MAQRLMRFERLLELWQELSGYRRNQWLRSRDVSTVSGPLKISLSRESRGYQRQDIKTRSVTSYSLFHQLLLAILSSYSCIIHDLLLFLFIRWL